MTRRPGLGEAILPGGGDTATSINLRKRVDLVVRLAGPLGGKRVLDCGCGAGEYVRLLAESEGSTVFGIEYQPSKLWRATPVPRLSLAAGDIQRMPFPDHAFDLAIVNEVLEHVPDDAAGLVEVHRVLCPGGLVIVFSPNRLYPFETHGTFLRRSGRRVPHYIPGIPYLPLSLGRIWLRYWARNYWPWEMKGLLQRAGFRIERRRFVWQTFENISGHQPPMVRRMSATLRSAAVLLERVPMVRSIGASQMIVARRPDEGHVSPARRTATRA